MSQFGSWILSPLQISLFKLWSWLLLPLLFWNSDPCVVFCVFTSLFSYLPATYSVWVNLFLFMCPSVFIKCLRFFSSSQCFWIDLIFLFEMGGGSATPLWTMNISFMFFKVSSFSSAILTWSIVPSVFESPPEVVARQRHQYFIVAEECNWMYKVSTH